MKNMTKRIRTLLALGVMTVATASTIVPVNALSQDTLKNCTAKDSLSVCINGVNRKLPLNNNCENKFTMPEHKVLSKFTMPECNITNNNKDNTTTVEKPAVKPDENKDNTTVEKPSVKPDENKDNTTVEKPSVKPDENKDNTATDKPVVKPDENNTDNTAGNFSAFQKEVTDLVNVERTNRGLKPLTLDSQISNVATKKSQDMIDKNYFDHNSPTYGSPFDMMKQFGISYKSAGENIAMGQNNPKEVVNAWMNSKGHRENILNTNFTNIGVGIAKNSNGSIYWTQMFVGR
ncbi:CAP domain-containing protein [Romboutsia sedimentorum]|uniref:CAP domain-containing protein n=1 Tax=Romboutsia sedimentorum TaxID=1368474 RepID=UPI0024DEE179|nr:CAP domain-containing protein [Romboutsia sedimentorum]MDK2585404.1 CAP domain-containing protein [Romboutsia sedimentorum]